MPKPVIVIDLGDEKCTLSADLSARIMAAARRRKKSAAHVIRLALRQKIRVLEEGRLDDLADRLGCDRREAQARAVLFLSTYLRESQVGAA